MQRLYEFLCARDNKYISHYVPKLDITIDDCCLLTLRFNKTVSIQLAPIKLTTIDLSELGYANRKGEFNQIVTN